MLGIGTKKDIKELEKYVWDRDLEIRKEIEVLRSISQKMPLNSADYAQRIADLEVKMAKLWGLLLDSTPKGKDRLTRFGKKFGGQSKGLL